MSRATAVLAVIAGGSAFVVTGSTIAAAAGDSCGYPVGTSGLPATAFNESSVLRGATLVGSGLDTKVAAFYGDEHALTLGVFTAGNPVTTMAQAKLQNPLDATSTTAHASSPVLLGDKTLKDPSLRPIYPALFITDVTSNSNANSGDWQQGGAPESAPDDVFGTWKNATVTNNAIVNGTDPTKNNLVLGPGSDQTAFNALAPKNEGYSAETRWNVSSLTIGGQPLTPLHKYRIQVMVHDGDQNKGGGDVGEFCAVVTIPGPPDIGTVANSTSAQQGQAPLETLHVPVGNLVNDTATIGGPFGPATGTVSFSLWYDQTGAFNPPDEATCESTITGLTQVAKQGGGTTDVKTITVSNGTASAKSSDYQISSFPNSYFWFTVYTPDSAALAAGYTSTKECGVESVVPVQSRILLTPHTATNSVGTLHTVAADVQIKDGTGSWTSLDGVQVTFSLSGSSGNTAAFVPAAPAGNKCTTASGAGCTVSFNDTVAEALTVHASTGTFTAPNVNGTFPALSTSNNCAQNTCDATKTYMAARILLTPNAATNFVGKPHTVTARVQTTTDNGTTWTDQDGVVVTLTVNGSAKWTANSLQTTTCTTAGGAGCTATLNDTVAETLTIHAEALNFTLSGVGGSFSVSTTAGSCNDNTCNATKIYANPGTTLTVTDKMTGLPVAANGSVTYSWYDNASCQGSGTSLGTKTVTSGVAQSSDSLDVPPGTHVWFVAHYVDSGSLGTFDTGCTESASSG